jgi:hypothetical protein
MFEHVSPAEAVTWAALIFVTGFIGFFGKALGRSILSFFQKKKAAMPPQAGPTTHVPPSGEALTSQDTPSKDPLKPIKKSMKAQAKAQKKLGK